MVLAAGDMIVRENVRRQAIAAGNFSHLWRGVVPLVGLADAAFLNFEGTAGGVTPDGELVRGAVDWTDDAVFTGRKIKGGCVPPLHRNRRTPLLRAATSPSTPFSHRNP